MASTGLISPLSRRMWNVVISRPNLINLIYMKHLLHGIVECIQESCIVVQHGVMNRFVHSIYEEMSIFSFIRICLPMQQNFW